MEISELLEDVRELPPSARVLPRLQGLLRNNTAEANDIVELLKVDAGLAAQVLRFSNSAYFSGGIPCESIDHAVQRLGFQTVYQLVATAASHALLDPPMEIYRLEKGDLMARSVALAVFSQAVNAELKLQDHSEALYTAGLLHGIGKVAINQYYKRKGFEVYDLSGDKALDSELEVRLVGCTHAEAGSALLEHWKFSPAIIELIRYQAEPEKAPLVSGLAQILHFGTRSLEVVLDDSREVSSLVADSYLETSGLSPDAVESIVVKVREDLKKLSSQL